MDRISLLPDHLLHHILSFLNIKSVIQTCVLSKRWKTLWTDIPTLNFDFDNYPFEDSTENGPNYKYFSIDHFISRVFSDYRCNSIQKLTYSSSIDTDDAGLIVELLINYAQHRQVSELCINTFNAVHFFWPLDLLKCSSLTVLKMSCGFLDDWKKLYFPWLRILEIRYHCRDLVFIAESEDITKLWDCPRLESLVLLDCFFGSVTISAPKLENFEFSFPSSKWDLSLAQVKLLTPKLKRVKLYNALPIVKSDSELSCIHEVNIAVDNSEFVGNGSATQNLIKKFSQFLHVFRNARSFTLPLQAMEVLCSIPPSLSRFSLHNLRHLKLKTKETNCMISLPIRTLMSSLNCPNLEMLEVGHNQKSRLAFYQNVGQPFGLIPPLSTLISTPTHLKSQLEVAPIRNKRFIARVFSDHRCKSIQKLSYSSSINTHEAGLVVELLINYARQRQVREFCINTFNSVYLAWPLDLLKCSSLTVLKMTCGFVDEWKKLYFPWLRVLEIGYHYEDLVYIAEDITMLWDCPRLESLVVIDCIFGSVTISAPKLENFEFSFPTSEWDLVLPQVKLLTPKLKRVKLCNALPIVKSDSEFSCIHEVNIVVDNFEFDGDGSDTQSLIEKFFQLLHVFHNARSFTLPFQAMEVLLSSPPLSRFSFQNLRHLKLKLNATSYIKSLRLPISTLMSSLNCPNLEMLEVGLDQGVNQHKCELEQNVSLLLEENERRRQKGAQEDQEREELRARIDEFEAMAQQFLNQQEGSRGESQRRSQGDPST